MKKVLEGATATPFTTISGRPIERLYGPRDLSGFDPGRDLGEPGDEETTR